MIEVGHKRAVGYAADLIMCKVMRELFVWF